MLKPNYYLLFFLLYLTHFLSIGNAQNLSINEFMASNSSTIFDPDFTDYADWIEIYNAESAPVNIKNYFITDDLTNKQKYRITTDLIIPSNGYALLWADDRNSGNHANFKLSASGESIGLFNPSSTLIDAITFSEQQTDISEGRFPDGGTDGYKFFPASPGAANPEANIYNKLSEPLFSVSGGFYQSSLMLTLSQPEPGVTICYTTDGSIPTLSSFVYKANIQIDTTTVITVKAFKDNFAPSKAIVNTYFTNFQADLPVFSIATDPANFFSDATGIYVPEQTE